MVTYLARMCAQLAQVTVYLSLALLISWQVTIASIIAGAVIFLALDGFVGLARRASRDGLTALRMLLSRLTDTLQGIKPLKAMALEDMVAPLLEKEIETYSNSSRTAVMAKEAMANIQEPFLVLVLCSGIYVVLTFTMLSFDVVIIMGMLFYRTAGRIAMMQQSYQIITSSMEYYVALKEKTSQAQASREDSAGKTAPSFSIAVRLENVDFSYGEEMVLDDVSILIPAGKITLISGPSGVGKTTAADLVLGFISPSRGLVTVDGVDLNEINIRTWRSKIGYVPQELFLFHESIARTPIHQRGRRGASTPEGRSDGFHRRAAGRYSHNGGRAWLAPIRRTAPANFHRTCPGPKPPNARTRRAYNSTGFKYGARNL
jgi:ATP-binding cassette subfamily C protein